MQLSNVSYQMEFVGQYCIIYNYVYIQGIVQNVDVDVDGSDFMATGNQSEEEENKTDQESEEQDEDMITGIREI